MSIHLAGSITAISEDSLAGDPPALGAEEADDRRDILDHGQPTLQAVGLVEFDGFGGFLGIEEGCAG